MKIQLPQGTQVAGPARTAWPGAPRPPVDDLSQEAIVAWIEQRRQRYPDDPYRAGICVMLTVWPPESPNTGTPRIAVVHATPHTLLTDEALASAYRRATSPDVTLTWQGHLGYDGHTEVAADLEHQRTYPKHRTTPAHPLQQKHHSVGGLIAHPECIPCSCGWVPPSQRPHHNDHRCHGAHTCWWGWLLKIEATNQTTVYRITDYDLEHHGWRAQWTD